MIVFVIISIFPAIGTAYLLIYGNMTLGLIGLVCTLVWWAYLWTNHTHTHSMSVYERAEMDYLLRKQEMWRALNDGIVSMAEFNSWDKKENDKLDAIHSNPLNNVVHYTRD